MNQLIQINIKFEVISNSKLFFFKYDNKMQKGFTYLFFLKSMNK